MSPFMLAILDHGFYVFHLLLTLFNVFGWVSRRTRKLHRWCVGITAGCWLTIGPILYGTVGYCPLTDWHWDIKEMRGEKNLPGSFITYIFHQAGLHPDPAHVNTAVGIVFFLVVLITLALWVRERKARNIV